MTDITEKQPLRTFAEKAYLDYAMYVILDRALPYIGDGLKPVQRRIIYAMSELSLTALAKYKKSARTVGDVLGKYHPHGDQACYEAMVLMAQAFATRYPLIDGQGNWGSMDDPKSFAAMRYTESKMTKYAELLLHELGKGTVDWTANFDGTLQEPKFLPARVPNVLLNGASGIAVGMATDIPSHNLVEVVNACVQLLTKPKSSLNEIMQHIPGPDLPSAAEIITPPQELYEMYEKGVGSIRVRAVYIKEKNDIVITALPPQVSGAKIQEQIALQMRNKKLPMIADLRDESDHANPTRIVIEPRSNRIDNEKLMHHLFATTDLEKTYRVNLNVIGLDGRPQVKNLVTILHEWLQYRIITVKRRTEYQLNKIINRLHILDGLLIAFLNIDKIINIIRSEDHPKPILIKSFKLTETQAEAILELKLRNIAKLEEMKITAEQKTLSEEREDLADILDKPNKLKQLVQTELLEVAKTYGDERLSPIVERTQAQAIREDTMIPVENVTIILSQQGWIRSAKGHEINLQNLTFKAGDKLMMTAEGRNNQLVAFLDSTGRSYSLLVNKLPSARGQGDPLTSYFTPPVGANFVGMLLNEPNKFYLVAADSGYGFVAKLEDFYSKNKNGKAILKTAKNSRALPPVPIDNLEEQYLATITNEGRLLLFPIACLPILAKGKGNKIINIPSAKIKTHEEFVVAITVLHENNDLIVYSGKRHLTLGPKDLAHYQGERGRRGNLLPRGFRNVDAVEVS